MLLAEGKNVGAGVILHVVETTVIPTVPKVWQGSKTNTVSTCKQWVQSVRLQMHGLPLVLNWSSSRLIPESCTVHEERQFSPRSPLWMQAKTCRFCHPHFIGAFFVTEMRACLFELCAENPLQNLFLLGYTSTKLSSACQHGFRLD